MKILTLIVALLGLLSAEIASACPACQTRVGQPYAVPVAHLGPVQPVPRLHHHHARRVPMSPVMHTGCSSCGMAMPVASPCGGCGVPYAAPQCGTGCGTGCSTGGCGTTTIRYCVRIPSSCGCGYVTKCYRLTRVPPGTPGAVRLPMATSTARPVGMPHPFPVAHGGMYSSAMPISTIHGVGYLNGSGRIIGYVPRSQLFGNGAMGGMVRPVGMPQAMPMQIPVR